MKLSVRTTLTLHAVIVSVLLLTPVIALFNLSSKSEAQLKLLDNINSNILTQLVTIDGALKNARFHSYAGFMHDTNLSVAHYHKHPFELHLETVNKELALAEQSWRTILANLSAQDEYYRDINQLKRDYDSYMKAGGIPVRDALQARDWDSIVRIVTAAIPQYAQYSDSGNKLVEKVKAIAQADYQTSLQELSSLRNVLMVLYILLVIGYFGFSIWLQRRIVTPLNDNVKMAERIAAGDLAFQHSSDRVDEFGDLANAMEKMRAELAGMISGIKQQAMQIEGFSQELKQSSSSVAGSINEQMHGLTNSASVLEQLTVSIDAITQNSETSNDQAIAMEQSSAQSFDQIANTEVGIIETNELLQTTSSQVERLSAQVDEITSITGVIQDVASQTNLLALNAAIEAARAGEQGRGFAVVADEVRNLAATTTDSVEQIAKMIASIQANASATVLSMQESQANSAKVVDSTKTAKASIGAIKQSASSVQVAIAEVARTLSEQQFAANELASSVDSIAAYSKENNAAITNVSATAENMIVTSEALKQTITKFSLN